MDGERGHAGQGRGWARYNADKGMKTSEKTTERRRAAKIPTTTLTLSYVATLVGEGWIISRLRIERKIINLGGRLGKLVVFEFFTGFGTIQRCMHQLV